MSEHASWDFEQGDELREGRTVLQILGGGSRYEVCLVWDDALYALGVAEVLRPDQAGDEKGLRDLAREVEVLEALAHPSLVRSFDAILDRPLHAARVVRRRVGRDADRPRRRRLGPRRDAPPRDPW